MAVDLVIVEEFLDLRRDLRWIGFPFTLRSSLVQELAKHHKRSQLVRFPHDSES